MADKGTSLEDIQDSLKDLKKNVRWLYDMISRNREESNKTMEWMAQQIDNQDTCIEDNHHNLYEIMGNIGYMKDGFKYLVNMN